MNPTVAELVAKAASLITFSVLCSGFRLEREPRPRALGDAQIGRWPTLIQAPSEGMSTFGLLLAEVSAPGTLGSMTVQTHCAVQADERAGRAGFPCALTRPHVEEMHPAKRLCT